MAKSGKKPEAKQCQLWCECECANCEIGAHERCNFPKCHMLKWAGRQAQDARKRPLAQVLLSKLPELELEFLRRVDSLLYEQGIHRIDCRTKAFLA